MKRKSIYKEPVLKIVALIVFGCMAVAGSVAQDKPMSVEKVHVLLNKNLVVSGDYLEYATTLEPDGSGINSTLVYYQLVDFNNAVIHQWRQPLHNGFNSGQLAIPEKLVSGIYTLKAFTLSIARLPDSYLAIQPLVILQFNAKIPTFLRFSTTSFLPVQMHQYFNDNTGSLPLPEMDFLLDNSGNLAKIQLSDSINEMNEELEFGIEINTTANYFPISVSVKEQTPFDRLFYNRQMWQKEPTETGASLGKSLNYKERQFRLVEGTVADSLSGKPLQNCCITAAWPHHSAYFKQAFTDSSGHFIFLFDSLWDNHLVYFQVSGARQGNQPVRWNFDDNTEQPGNTYVDSVPLTDCQTGYLARLLKASLVQRIYFEQQKSVQKLNSDSLPSFYGIPDRIIYPSEYYALNNFVEICANIIPGVTLSKNHKEYSFSMVLRDNQPLAKEHILVLLNGVPFSNYSYIALLSSAAIQRIEVFNTAFVYGRLKYNGALAIYTFDKLLKPEWFNNPVYIFNNQTGIQPISVKPNYPVSLPALGPDIFWQVLPNASNNQRFKVKLLLHSGKYIIGLLGITSEGGCMHNEKLVTVPSSVK